MANDTLDEKVFNAPPYPEGDRKGPIPASTLPSPLQRRRGADESYRIFVRARAVESRVGTLAVALGVELGNHCLAVALACGFAVFLAFASRV